MILADYQIIPKPASIETSNGQFLVDSNTKVVGAAALENEGNYLARLISNSTLADTSFEVGTNVDGNILLKIDASIEHSSCILTDQVALVIPILYHLNGNTFGSSHVPDAEEVVQMLAYFQ